MFLKLLNLPLRAKFSKTIPAREGLIPVKLGRTKFVIKIAGEKGGGSWENKGFKFF